MDNCKLVFNSEGQILHGIAENGVRSILADSLIELGLNESNLMNRWALTRTPIFKRWFGNSKTVDVNGEPRLLFLEGNPVYKAEDGTIKHAILNTGEFTASQPEVLIEKLNAKYALTNTQGNPLNVAYGADIRAEKIEKANPGISATVLQDSGGEYIKLSLDNSIYNQQASAGKSDSNINSAMISFLKTIGVNVQMVNSLKNSKGELLDAVAKADMLSKIVQIVEGKAGIDTLPEEAAHFLVNLLEASGHPLYKALSNNVSSYAVYQEVVNNPFYQEQYQGNENMLRKEAIGKLIAAHVTGQTSVTENKAKVSRLDKWLDKVLEFLQGIFGKVADNPYSEAALILLNSTVSDYISEDVIKDTTLGEFFQEKNEDTVTPEVYTNTQEMLDLENTLWEIESIDSSKITGLKKGVVQPGDTKVDRYFGKDNTIMKGKMMIGRVSDAVSAYFHKQGYNNIKRTKEEQEFMDHNASVKMAMGTAGHATLEDLVNFHANKKGSLDSILKESPFNKAQFNTLSVNVKKMITHAKKVQKGIDPKGKVSFR